MVKVFVDIQTYDTRLDYELFPAREHRAGETQVQVGAQARIIWNGMSIYKGVDIPRVFNLIVEFADELGIALLADYIVNKLKGKKRTKIIVRNRREIEIDTEELNGEQIVKILTEIRKEEKST